MDMTWADEVLAGHPFVVAHRGASAARPEHTLAAYDLALKEGADGVECDVRLTGTGIWSVCMTAAWTEPRREPAWSAR